MPQVPLLTPEVSPQNVGLPQANIPVSSDSFGGAVAHALQGLGAGVEQAGDRIWQRAVEMQNLQNESEVDKGDEAFMEKAGILHANFSALQGEAARAAFPKYLQDLREARESIKNTMSNPMTQKMFDRTSLSTLGRTIFNAAGHAATQSKVAAIDAVKSRMQTMQDYAANSDDPREVEATRGGLMELNRKLHGLQGTPESIPDSEHAINSSLAANTMINTAKTDPFTAKTELEAKKKTLSQEDYNRVDRFITTQRRAVGSANTADEIWEAGRGTDKRPELSEDAMVELGKKRAKEDAPDDPIYAQHVEAAIHTKYTREKQASRQFEWDNKQVIASALQNGATSVQELLANPKTAAAYHGLTETEQNAVPGQINRYIRARDYAANQAAMTQLNGLRNNDVESFLNTDPTDPKFKLSQGQIREVQNWQEQDKKNPNGDPRVNRAMAWLRGPIGAQLQALGIYHRKEQDHEDYDRFTGLLSESLTAWQSSHGKPAEYKDVVETIAPQLLKTHITKGMFWNGTSDPAFKSVLDSASFKDFAKEQAVSRQDQGLPAPTTEETERLYYHSIAQTIFGKKSK